MRGEELLKYPIRLVSRISGIDVGKDVYQYYRKPIQTKEKTTPPANKALSFTGGALSGALEFAFPLSARFCQYAAKNPGQYFENPVDIRIPLALVIDLGTDILTSSLWYVGMQKEAAALKLGMNTGSHMIIDAAGVISRLASRRMNRVLAA